MLINLAHQVSRCLLSIVWNLIRPGGHAHRKVTKTVHKTQPEGVIDAGNLGVYGLKG